MTYANRIDAHQLKFAIRPCRIVLDWPAAELFPNRSNGKHWGSRQPFKIAARSAAYCAADGLNIGDTSIDHAIAIFISPPDNRRRDVDGILSALKPSLDGIAKALHIDDQHFNPIHVERLEPIEGGRIVVIINDSIPF